MTRTPSTAFLVGVLVFQQIVGALTFPIAKYGLTHIEPFTFALYRYLISSAVLLMFVKMTNTKVPIERCDVWKIFGLGIIIIPFNQTFYLWGQSMTAAGHGSVLFATVPIWIVMAAMIHLKEKLSWRRGIGIVIAMIGVFAIVTGGAVEIGTEYLLGDLLILVAVIAWVYYTIIGKPLVQKYGAIRITAYALASGSLLYTPFGLYMAANFDHSLVPAAAWWSVLYVAIGTSVIAYVLWYWVLKYMEASRIAVFHNIQPVIASGVAFVWLGEPMGLSFLAGGAVALIGVIIAEL